MGHFKDFYYRQQQSESAGEEKHPVRGKREAGITESKAVLARRIISKYRRLRASKDLHEKLDLLASQNADLAMLISAEGETSSA
jgi:hypothetical protein